MTVIKCVKCDDKMIKPFDPEPPAMCSSCRTGLQEEINRIDRNKDRYTKRGKLKNRLHDIPEEAIPESMKLQIEEVADPNIERRQHSLGKLNELKVIGDKEINKIKHDATEYDRGKILLKKRYR
jgi:hypothetical protein